MRLDTFTPSPSLSGAALATAVGAQAADGQKGHRYEDAAEELFATIDDVTGNDEVLDIYTGTIAAGVNDRGSASQHQLNVEHTWPRSHGAKGMAEADLHHLRASDRGANGARGSYMYGVIGAGQEITYETSHGPWTARLGKSDDQRRVFEPPAEVVGDIARGMLYFAARYGTGQSGAAHAIDGAKFLQQLPTLLAWNEQDPVTDAERARNDRVEAYQGNRNPFIDDASLASRIGFDGFRDALTAADQVRSPH